MENLTLEESPPQGAPGGAQMATLGPGIPPPQNQQLPPQMFTTAAQLLDMTDSRYFINFTCKSFSRAVGLLSAIHLSLPHTNFPKNKSYCETFLLCLYSAGRKKANPAPPEKLMVALRDGRKLIGVLRSWDQFGTSPSLPSPSL